MRQSSIRGRGSPATGVRAALLAFAPVFLFTGAYALARANGRSPRSQPDEKKGGKPQQKPSRPGLLPRPLEGNYSATLATAIIALAPFIVVSTAYVLFSRQLQDELHGGQLGSEIISGLAIAGYAFGAFTGGDIVQRFPQRRLFFICELLFALGCLASAAAHGMVGYGFGRVLAGFATGLLLVVALPPVIQQFPPEKLPITVVFINLGFFGAVCIGPLLGGWVASGHAWRWFYAALGAIAFLNFIVALFTLPLRDAMNPGLPLDPLAGLLGLPAVVLPFWASGELAAHGFISPYFAVLMGVGLVCFIALILSEYHQKNALSPVKKMWTTPSIVGVLTAMIGGGVFVTFLELGEQLQLQVVHRSPLETGLLFWPLALAVCVTAGLLGALIKTRFLPLLVLGGMACLAGGGALILNLGPSGDPALTLAAAALLGLGAGATVSPGLYLAAFPLPVMVVGRVFALVELVRSLADYIIAPVVLKIAREGSYQPPLDWPGVHEATWITLWITVALTVIGAVLWVAGGMGLPVPDLKAWIDKGETAITPTPLLGLLRANPPPVSAE